ncbi:15-hydroxyprostaglandin dehydrogenase [NAD(+)]-like [Trichoplusia ni]|uniref:15-hydroxyprostaglandin dehydrogenase [NAD(+)]-like n=1 Tax=Trichoplusia ni TaxID=7111 RepID=A0A7E5WQ77_TRINI|nr:15-hydroxyprostaglandin dehydrogenase [NAD(+)]-like [Trichoplusia ni]XP_026742811.1 15-hydroxyprostaglandin dehydrogenase [NAD(+)]-like [Trichoplusia ni]
MYDLNDKIVVITGGSNGIGAVVADHFLAEGAKHIRILDVDEKSGLSLQASLNEKYGEDKVKFSECDVTNTEQFFRALVDAKEDNGFIDVLINNAGIPDESTVDIVRKQIEINYIATVFGTLKGLELMRTDKGGRGGAIINISSIAGLAPICPPLFVYSSNKKAVLQFSTCIGKDTCANTGVRVIGVAYGVTDTPILKTMNTFDRQFDETVKAIVNSVPIQSSEDAARGTVEVFKNAESASIWLVHRSQPATEVTKILEEADKEIIRILCE